MNKKQTKKVNLLFNISFEDLYDSTGLKKVDSAFLKYLADQDTQLHIEYLGQRKTGGFSSDIALKLAPIFESFIGELLTIQPDVLALQKAHHKLAPLYTTRRFFVQRVACKKYRDVGNDFPADTIRPQLLDNRWDDLDFALKIGQWQKQGNQEKLDLAAQYAAWATLTQSGQAHHVGSVLFKAPKKLDPQSLIPLVEFETHGLKACGLHQDKLRTRDGFNLTDEGFTREQALGEVNYCIWCHHQDKDSCSKGLAPKKNQPSVGPFAKNELGNTLTGCPLEEKISEMNEAKAQGYSIASLGIICVDNPMVAGTGHRICNDCMKACVFQKQDPVDIPGAETQTLRDVLNLPYGFEIYSLLTRWNPFNFENPVSKPDSGYKVLVVGMGPAGYTLAHHLMNQGHAVVGVDGLKIEPLPPELCGANLTGKSVPFEPIENIQDILESLDERITYGFGGVAEYGITVRWDKNFLKIIRLLLERRTQFQLYGGVRFGGTLTIDQAFELGFDHIALSMGAGKPTMISVENALAGGVRMASDFLMALQSTGAAKKDSVANLQVRLPAAVIGGGLTAIDTATETLAYYPRQVEKFLERYEALCESLDESLVRGQWRPHELEIADEFLAHGRAIRQERKMASKEERQPNFKPLIDEWGGVSLIYRKAVQDAPSYRQNHEEVEKAMEEGVQIIEKTTPVKIEIDGLDNACSLIVEGPDGQRSMPAHTVLIAAGTKPNTNLRYDDPGNIVIEGKTFQSVNLEGNVVKPDPYAKPSQANVLMRFFGSGVKKDKALSFFGDLHPSFAGNVVKAMASAKQGYPAVCEALRKCAPSEVTREELFIQLNKGLRAEVVEVKRLTPTIIEVLVKAPFAAKAFKPGQFYRLQNFETLAPKLKGTRMAMEGLALTGASVDREAGVLSTIVLEMGGSSDLCALLKPGEPVVLMGPTGEPTVTPEGETVLLAGGGLGNAVLFSIGQQLKENGSRVVYFAGYKKLQDRYKIKEIEAAADIVIWCCDESPGFEPTRPQDMTYVGNIVEAMQAYAKGQLGGPQIPLEEVNRMIVIGSDRMMGAVASARHNQLKVHLHPKHVAIGSINSPMQCMMKEICAQCLQVHKDPETGVETIVYSCANQDQPLDKVDFNCLSRRLQQNAVQEKLTHLWIQHCLQETKREQRQ